MDSYPKLLVEFLLNCVLMICKNVINTSIFYLETIPKYVCKQAHRFLGSMQKGNGTQRITADDKQSHIST